MQSNWRNFEEDNAIKKKIEKRYRQRDVVCNKLAELVSFNN